MSFYVTSIVSRSLVKAVSMTVDCVSPFLSSCFYVFLFSHFEVFIIVLGLLFQWWNLILTPKCSQFLSEVRNISLSIISSELCTKTVEYNCFFSGTGACSTFGCRRIKIQASTHHAIHVLMCCTMSLNLCVWHLFIMGRTTFGKVDISWLHL